MIPIAQSEAISKALLRDGHPRNKWFALVLDPDTKPEPHLKFAAIIANDGSSREFTYVTNKNSNGYFVLIGIYNSDGTLVVAEFQIDDHDIILLTDCFSTCDNVLPLESNLFERLRNGSCLRFGGTIKRPPERDFRTVSLDGIDGVLDELD